MNLTVYNVRFPDLNLNFKINPVAFKIGNITVHWYGIIICIGFLLALFYVLFNCKRFNLNSNSITDAIIVGVLCGIIGARLYYVIFFPGDLYWKNPSKIFNINEGGIAIYGGIIAGLLGGILVAQKKKLNVMAALDLTALGLLIGQGVGRWGNFVNQEAYGIPTDNFFRMISENTENVAVHPCFLYESIWCILGFILLHVFSLKRRKYNGQIFWLYLIWYGVERFFVEALRTDSLVVPGVNLRISQLVALFAIIVGSSMIFYNWYILKKDIVKNRNIQQK